MKLYALALLPLLWAGCGDDLVPQAPPEPLVCDSWTGDEQHLDLTNDCEFLCVAAGFTAEQYPEDLLPEQRAQGLEACNSMVEHYLGLQGLWAAQHLKAALYWRYHIVASNQGYTS